MSTDHIIEDLVSGNRYFTESNIEKRGELVKSQNPKAVVLCCSDSRVSPELIFNQELGDLFVVRVAGNILNEENLGSIEYAVEHLNVPLIIVMGHSSCGAVAAAVKGNGAHGHVKSIVNAIKLAVKDSVEETSRENVKISVEKLRTMFTIKVVGAYYDLNTGKVSFLE